MKIRLIDFALLSATAWVCVMFYTRPISENPVWEALDNLTWITTMVLYGAHLFTEWRKK